MAIYEVVFTVPVRVQVDDVTSPDEAIGKARRSLEAEVVAEPSGYRIGVIETREVVSPPRE